MHNILIYGTCQYKCGGVACHTKRLNRYLKEKSTDIDLRYYHYDKCVSPLCGQRLSPSRLFLLLSKIDVQLIQVYSFCSWRIMLSVYFASKLFGIKVVSTIRNDRFKDLYGALQFWEKAITRLFYSQVVRLIAVNVETDFIFVPKERIEVIPGYIPPSADELTEEKIPKAIKNFLNHHQFCMISNASYLRHVNGEDLYGLDLAINLILALQTGPYNGVGLIFVIPRVHRDSQKHFDRVKELVSREGLTANVLIWEMPVTFPAILTKCDLSLRLTGRDGDSASVRESLSLGVPVIASDAAPRPEGTVLFRSRDSNDLKNKTIEILKNLDKYRSRIKTLRFEDNAMKMIKLWQSILE